MSYREIDGDLIELALNGEFEVITHGCNCFSVMGAGIAPKMDKTFGCNNPNLYKLENKCTAGDINKLGQIEHNLFNLPTNKTIFVINSYTQYGFGKNHSNGTSKPIDYDALTLCMRKINVLFAGRKIGLPRIGSGLGGGDWERIKTIIQNELSNMDIIVVNYVPR